MDEVEKTIHSLAGHRCENCVWADWVEIKRTSLLDEKKYDRTILQNIYRFEFRS